MEDKRMTSAVVWHLVEEEGNPGWGQYIITSETGTVLPAKYDLFDKRWKLPGNVKVLAWAEMPEPCEACPIEVITARKEFERAKANYEKAMEKYNIATKEM